MEVDGQAGEHADFGESVQSGVEECAFGRSESKSPGDPPVEDIGRAPKENPPSSQHGPPEGKGHT